MNLPGLDVADNFSVAPGLSLPLDTEGHRIGVLGTSGAGKTSVSKVIVEALIAAGRRVCILDPAGVWWGLRLSSDGQSPGLPVIVFGGRRADVPLDAGAGAAVADLVADEGLPVILDLSGFEDDADLWQVTADFVRRLRFRQGEGIHDPILLVVDEADLLAPQTARKGTEQACQSALRGVARRGRSDGLGLMTITQRPVGLHTDIVSMAEASFLLRFTGDNDLERIKGWLGASFPRPQIEQVLSAIPSLADGECFAASPGWLKTLTRTQFPRPQTFDSSAAPKAGMARPSSEARADVDLSALAARFAKAIQEEQENDPEALRKRIMVLQAQLRDVPKPVERVVEKTVEVEKRVEVPVLAPGQLEQLQDTAEALIAGGKDMASFGQEILARVGLVQQAERPTKQAVSAEKQEVPTKSTMMGTSERPAADAGVVLNAVGIPSSAKVNSSVDALPGGAQRMLQMLARCHAMQISEAQLGSLTKLTPSGGTWSKYMGLLKAEKLVAVQNGRLQITARGLARLGKNIPPEPRTTEDVLTMWDPALSNKEREMLRLLVSLHPKGITAEGLAARLNLTHGAGTFSKYLSTLKSNGLVKTTSAGVFAGDILFPGHGVSSKVV